MRFSEAFKNKKPLLFSAFIAVFACFAGAVSTMTWFQVNNSASPSQPAQTKSVQTNAKVYQPNSRSNDDTYQKELTSDKGGTLSYNHSKGGVATNYYIRQYGGSETTLQMYTNVENGTDKAVYYNVKFVGNWKIYDSVTNAYYGYGDIDGSCPIKSTKFSAQGVSGSGADENIVCTDTSSYYDVYFTKGSKIWIELHFDVTTSDEMGNRTGYYIYGHAADSFSSLNNHADMQRGIPMYVNAAADTSDKAFYAGLRLSAGDYFYIAAGDSTDAYKTADSTGLIGSDPEQVDGSLSFNSTDGKITCNTVGYFSIALKSSNTIYIEHWDGFEADGKTRYRVTDSGGTELRSYRPKASGNSGVKRTIAAGSTFYLGLNGCGDWRADNPNFAAYFFHEDVTVYDDDYVYLQPNDNWKEAGARFAVYFFGGTGDDGWVGMESDGDYYKAAKEGFGDATSIIFCRMNPATSDNNWNNKWNQTSNLTLPISGSNNIYEITGWDESGQWKTENGRHFHQEDITEWVRLSPIGNNYYSGVMPSYAYPNVVFVRLDPGADSGTGTPDWDNAWNQTVDLSMPGDGSSNNCFNVNNTKDGEEKYQGSWSLFTTYTVTYHLVASNSTDISEYNPSVTLAQTGATWTVANLPDIRANGYGLVNSTYWYDGSDGKTGTTYTAGSSHDPIPGDLDLYARYDPLSSCTIEYYIAEDGVAEAEPLDTNATYQTADFEVINLPSGRDGYGLVGWKTSPDGTGSTYTAGETYTCPSESTLTLYACYSVITYDYYIYGVVDGNTNWDNSGDATSGQIHQTGNVNSTTISWSQHFNAGDIWRIYRPTYFEGTNPAIWDGACLQSTPYAENQAGLDDTHNVHMLFSGTFNVTLTLSNGHIDLSLSNLDASNFTLHQCNSSLGDASTVSATRIDNDHFRFSVDSFNAGYYWHIQGPDASYIWGWSLSENISATSNYSYWFADSASVVTASKPNRVKNLYSMSCTIDFYFSGTNANQIVISAISLTSSQFSIKTVGGSTLQSASASSFNGTVTFNNVALATDSPWNMQVAGGATYSFNDINTNVSVLGQNVAKGTYFYIADDGANWIGTGYGGTYKVVFDIPTKKLSITCVSFNDDDFVATRIDPKGGESTVSLGSITMNDSTHTATYTSSVHMYVGDQLYFKNNNTGRSTSGSCTHNYYFDGDIIDESIVSSPFIYVSGSYLVCRVDVTLNLTFVFLGTSGGNLTKANVTVSSVTENGVSGNSKISFDHAKAAGIYLETADNSSFSEATRVMMHTTSNNDLLAQEAPVLTSSGTYMRIVKTHSNGSAHKPGDDKGGGGTYTTEELTEYYYVAQGGSPYSTTYFESSTNIVNAEGNGGSEYIQVKTGGKWTISISTSNTVKIEPYSGTSTQSAEHQVPYYLVGTGLPGSDLRTHDFTIGNGVQLWTYGGNSSNLPCYVGKYAVDNTSSSNYQGTGIDLKSGDEFALSTSSEVIKVFAETTGAVTTNTTTGIVSVNESGHYQIYIDAESTVHISKTGSGSSWSRSGSIVAQSMANGTLVIGGNLDYSLLDYENGGYTFEVELTHVYSGTSGTMTYVINNGNSDYSIGVNLKASAYGTGAYAGDDTSCEYNVNNSSLTTPISNGTNTVCLRITIPASAIRSMISSGSFSFNMSVTYSFAEDNIS